MKRIWNTGLVLKKIAMIVVVIAVVTLVEKDAHAGILGKRYVAVKGELLFPDSLADDYLVGYGAVVRLPVIDNLDCVATFDYLARDFEDHSVKGEATVTGFGGRLEFLFRDKFAFSVLDDRMLPYAFAGISRSNNKMEVKNSNGAASAELDLTFIYSGAGVELSINEMFSVNAAVTYLWVWSDDLDEVGGEVGEGIGCNGGLNAWVTPSLRLFVDGYYSFDTQSKNIQAGCGIGF